MSSARDHSSSRREFLRIAARYGGLVSLTAALVWLGRNRPGQACINKSVCFGCAAFADCGLPAALSTKAARSSGGKS